jgi:transposase
LAMLTSLSTEDLIPKDHPIRRIRRVIEEVLAELDSEFEAMYSRIGRPSVPPEQLLKATVLMALYSMRSERAFCERLNYDLLFKWFLDLPIDAKAFDPTTFTKNRDRLLEAEIADRFFAAVVRQAKLRRYVSSDHFSVDGTLLEAWASHKSFKPKDGPVQHPPDHRPRHPDRIDPAGNVSQRDSKQPTSTGHTTAETATAITRAGYTPKQPFFRTLLGGRLLAKLGGQFADLGFRVATVPTEGLQEGQLALLGPAGHRLGRHMEEVGDLGGPQVAAVGGGGLAAA